MSEPDAPKPVTLVVASNDNAVVGAAVGPVERVAKRGLWIKLPVAVVVREKADEEER